MDLIWYDPLFPLTDYVQAKQLYNAQRELKLKKTNHPLKPILWTVAETIKQTPN